MSSKPSRPPLVSRFSDDGDETGTLQGLQGLTRRNINLALSDLLSNEKNGMLLGRPTVRTATRRTNSPPTVIRRITSKFRLASPTTTFAPPPTHQKDTSQEGEMLSRTSDGFPSCQYSDQYSCGRGRGERSFVVMRGSDFKGPSEVKTRFIEGFPSGPIYPHTLHDPQFCKSRSSSDLRRPTTSAVGLQAVSEWTTLDEALPLQWPESARGFSRAAYGLEHHRRRSSASSSTPPLSPSATIAKHPGVPIRTIPPVPTEAAYLSRSMPSSHNSWTAAPLTATSPRTSITSEHTSTNSCRRVSVDYPLRKSAEEAVRDLGIPTHLATVEQIPRLVENPMITGSISVQVENIESEPAVISFSTMHADEEGTVVESGPPRTSPEYYGSPTTNTSSQSIGTRRRKSFIGQSLNNLRRSLSRAKPKASPVLPFIS